MSVEETVKALRAISQDYENGNGGECFDICGECKNAADQLERLNDFQKSQCMKLMEKIVVLESKNERLKAEKPVRCGECIHFDFGVEFACRCKNGIAQDSWVGKDDFCSYGERRDAE